MFRFRIRDLLWLTAVVALTLGWWFDHRSLSLKVSSYREEIFDVAIAWAREVDHAVTVDVPGEGQWICESEFLQDAHALWGEGKHYRRIKRAGDEDRKQ